MKLQTVLKVTAKIFIIVILIGIIFAIAINLVVYFSTREKIVDYDSELLSDADCVLVLGAGVREDGSPSHMLEDRLKVGVDLYLNNVCDVILMSGDHGTKGYDEVNTMKQFAIDLTVPSEDVFMDHAGFSTYESLYRARDVFGAKKIIIVTQEYHLYRALYIAASLGIDAVGVSADLRPYSGQSLREIREVVARGKDFFYTVLKPEPTYLGDEISLSGSGDVTNDK